VLKLNSELGFGDNKVDLKSESNTGKQMIPQTNKRLSNDF